MSQDEVTKDVEKMNIEEYKTCSECHEQKHISRFYQIKNTGKYVSCCNDCKSKKKQEKRSSMIIDPSILYTCEDCHETKSCIEFKTLKVCLKCYYKREKEKTESKRKELNITILEKECPTCKKILLIENFSKCCSNADGYAANCKQCNSEYLKNYRKENAEDLKKKKQEQYYADPTILEKKAKYREEHREEIREKDRLRRERLRRDKNVS